MAWLISGLSKKEQRELLQDLNYLNTGEIKKFCERHRIPYRIVVEMKDGSWRRTKDDDRRGCDAAEGEAFFADGRRVTGDAVSFESRLF